MKKLDQGLYFLPLGGSEEIGMNLNLYCYKNKWIIVDMGISFHQMLGTSVVMPDATFLQKIKKDCLGILITHAHEDHIGALPYMIKTLDLPIYATEFTSNLIKRKFADHGVRGKIHIVEYREEVKLGPFQTQWLHITHSIPEASAIVIKTEDQVVLHTGDWKIDETPTLGDKTDKEILQKLGKKGVDVIVCDSTNIFEKGKSVSESQIKKNLKALIQKNNKVKKIVVACFASNIARLDICHSIAKDTKRKFSMVGHSMTKMAKIANLSLKTDLPTKNGHLEDTRELIVCTGSQGETNAALNKAIKGENPKLKLSKGDIIIFSSRIIPGNEKNIFSLQNLLIKKGITVINDDSINNIHSSGHPNQKDLETIYEWTQPKKIIPVHGETRHITAHVEFAQNWGISESIVPYNGSLISIKKDKLEQVDEIKTGKIVLDGNQLLPIHGNAMKQRHTLAENGCISITYGKSKVQVSIFGIGDIKEQEKMGQSIQKEIAKILKIKTKNHENLIKQSVMSYFFHTKKKHPLIILHRA